MKALVPSCVILFSLSVLLVACAAPVPNVQPTAQHTNVPPHATATPTAVAMVTPVPTPTAALSLTSNGAMFLANLQRTGVYQTRGVPQLRGVRWKVAVGAHPIKNPIVANGVVYVGLTEENNDEYLVALDSRTGREDWRVKGGSALALAGGIVYAGPQGVDKTTLYAIDATTRKQKWTATMNSGFSDVCGLPAVVDSTVYFGSYDRFLYALDSETGKERWKLNTRHSVCSAPAMLNGVIYVGNFDGYLIAVNARTGAELWRYNTQVSIRVAPSIADSLVFISSGDRMYGIDAQTGQAKWNVQLGKAINSSAAVINGTVYVTGFDYTEGNIAQTWRSLLYALDAKTGHVQWKFQSEMGGMSSPVIADGVVYVGAGTSISTRSDFGAFFAVDAQTGQLRWRLSVDRAVHSTSVIADGVVYFSTSDGFLYAVE